MPNITQILARIDQIKRSTAKNLQDPLGAIGLGLLRADEEFKQDPVNTVLGSANIGGGLLGTFVGPKSKVWNKVSADAFEALEKKGVSNKDAYLQTGTFRSPDGKLRQEIDDSQTTLNLDAPYKSQEWLGKTGAKFGDFVKNNPINDAYPRVKSSNVIFEPEMNSSGEFVKGIDLPYMKTPDLIKIRHSGNKKNPLEELQFFSDENLRKEIQENNRRVQILPDDYMDIYQVKTPEEALKIMNQRTTQHYKEMQRRFLNPSESELNPYTNFDKSVLLHEAQHGIQEIEGFSQGGSPKQFLSNDFGLTQGQAYQRLAGEAEARAVQARMNMTPEQRRASFPLDSYDVPLNQLIIQGLLK